MLSESQHLEPPVFLPTLPAKTPFTSSWVWEVSEKIGSGSFGDIYMGNEPINSDALVVGMVPVVWQGLMFARLLLLIGIRTDIRTLSEQSVIVVIVSNIKSHLDILISTYHDCSLLSSFICMFIGNHRNRIHCCLPGYELCIFTVPRYQHFYRRACGHQVGICQSPAPFVTRIHGIVICRHKCQSCSGSGPLVLLAWHDYWKLLIYVTSIFSFASWGWSSSPSCTNLSRMVWPWCQPRWECVKDIGLIFKKIRMKSPIGTLHANRDSTKDSTGLDFASASLGLSSKDDVRVVIPRYRSQLFIGMASKVSTMSWWLICLALHWRSTCLRLRYFNFFSPQRSKGLDTSPTELC